MIPTLGSNAALVLIDLQKGIVGLPTVVPADEIVRRARLLAEAARRVGIPVTLVNVVGGAPGRNELPTPTAPPSSEWTEIVPELDPHPTDARISKKRWNAFSNPELEQILQKHGVDQLILAGIATRMGVESTARAAHERGYHVVLVTDAMTDTSAEAHQNSVDRIFPKLGQRTTTLELIPLLNGS